MSELAVVMFDLTNNVMTVVMGEMPGPILAELKG